MTLQVKFEDLEAKGAVAEYHRIGETTTIVCSLTLPSGFVVIGQASCINPDVFDEQAGIELAHQDAMRKLWELEAYRVKENAFEAEKEANHG